MSEEEYPFVKSILTSKRIEWEKSLTTYKTNLKHANHNIENAKKKIQEIEAVLELMEK